MELDELKSAWRELNDKTDARITHLWREVKLDGTRGSLRRFSGVLVFELVAGVIAAILTGSVLIDGPHEAKFLVLAVILHVFAVVTIALPIWQLAKLGMIDRSGPVLDVQHRLARIAMVRVRSTQWLLILSPALWPPLAIVAFEGLLHVDVYRAFGTPWVVANVAFGLAAIPLILWAVHAVGTRFQGSRSIAWLLDEMTGRSLSAAIRDVDEIVRFEMEAS